MKSSNKKAKQRAAKKEEKLRAVAEKEESAFALLEEAAQQGDAKAQFDLAMLYAKGDGCGADIQFAAMLFELAAAGGHIPAQNILKEQHSLLDILKKNKEAEPELSLTKGHHSNRLLLEVQRLTAIMVRLRTEGMSAEIVQVYGRLLQHLQLAMAIVPGEDGKQSHIPAVPKLKTIRFSSSQQLHVDGIDGSVWHGEELEASWKKPAIGIQSRKLFMVKSFLSETEAESILKCARSVMHFQSFADSVDSKPSYENAVIRKHTFVNKHLEAIVKPIVENRLLPYIRKRYNIPNAVVCTSLVRRYLGEERRTHPTHRDTHALATAVLSLNAGEFCGGLYVQPELDSGSREFVPFECGDLAVHQYDLPHGVQVFSGDRYSMIFWFQDCVDSCRKDTTPWKEIAASGGDADAMCALASELKSERSVELYRQAADMGHVEAMRELGYLLHKAGRTEEACKFWQLAANERDGGATRMLATKGCSGFPDLSNSEVERLLVQAAESQDSISMLMLGARGYTCKNMSPKEREMAEQWLLKAANLGIPEAHYGLGIMHIGRSRKERQLGDLSPLSDDELQAIGHFKCAALNGIIDVDFSWLYGMQEAWFPLKA